MNADGSEEPSPRAARPRARRASATQPGVAHPGAAAPPSAAGAVGLAEPVGERRGPIVLTLLGAIAVRLLLPSHYLPGPRWLVPAVLAVLIVTMTAVDPGRIDRRSAWARATRIAVVVTLLVSSGWATGFLTYDLIYGYGSVTSSGPELIRCGSLVWIGMVISFAFLYWELDLGGPGERAHSIRRYPDFAFPQDLSPEVHRPGWRPEFVDYLYLGITDGLAVSPTDVMPLARWAKLTMAIESIASLALLGLVIARVVNIFK